MAGGALQLLDAVYDASVPLSDVILTHPSPSPVPAAAPAAFITPHAKSSPMLAAIRKLQRQLES
ncbi:hypothetical protein HETIRDRAFT_450301 [Heterobasidion irregulare TC 32-1]|uniref:Uncharacterized protein n=1 Tax=Heterobasidion irregulare (strain TC 32-1) TaxID=747525 RepID=W4K990_HETIT|nr:uncharacterized protein HETIRDRAFT_450301 [Heterobasidion irregulare TC 32-1]ETW82402.1 hypothetical protein HETIRDRAFT_450301 [Heterobasidion irregulare TC 32-1]